GAAIAPQVRNDGATACRGEGSNDPVEAARVVGKAVQEHHWKRVRGSVLLASDLEAGGAKTFHQTASSVMNSLFSDSASVGCANTPSLIAGYGTLPIIAICSIDMISPPSTPSTVQPSICRVFASTIAFMKPRVSLISIARATPRIGSFATR